MVAVEVVSDRLVGNEAFDFGDIGERSLIGEMEDVTSVLQRNPFNFRTSGRADFRCHSAVKTSPLLDVNCTTQQVDGAASRACLPGSIINHRDEDDVR